MCNKSNDSYLIIVNTFFSFLLMIYSCLIFTDVSLSQSAALPTNEIEEALLLGAEMEAENNKRTYEKQENVNSAWFGPRLGRKKRSLTLDEDVLENMDNKNHKSTLDDTVVQYLKNYPWVLVPIIREEYVSKRQDMKPRLGRGNSWSDEDEKMIKAPPFSPRLGRRSLIPLKPRLGRAEKNPENAVFKPRLGRDPNFNEFSEYIADARNNIDGKDH